MRLFRRYAKCKDCGVQFKPEEGEDSCPDCTDETPARRLVSHWDPPGVWIQHRSATRRRSPPLRTSSPEASTILENLEELE